MTLSAFLQKKKLTQSAFATGSGVNVATLSRFFNGVSMPSTENCGLIVTHTDGKVSFDDLVAEFAENQKAAQKAARA